MNENNQSNQGFLSLADALRENNQLSADTSAGIELLLDEVTTHSAFLANNAGPSFLNDTPALLSKLTEKIVSIGAIFFDGNKRLLNGISHLVSGNLSIATALKEGLVYEKKKDADTALDKKEDEAEKANKKKKELDPLGALSDFIKTALSKSTDFSFKGILTTFLFSIGFTAGLITDVFSRIFNVIKGIFKVITKGSTIVDYVKTLFSTLKTNIATIFNVIKLSIQESKIFKTVKSVFDGISGFFSRVSSLFKGGDKITSIGKIIGSVVSKIGGAFKGIFNNVLSFINPLLKGFKAGKTFISALGKLALPLTIFTSAIAGIIGAFKGFTGTEGSLLDKLLGGFKGLLVGIFDNLIGSLLNLVKDALGWVLGFLGFDNLQKIFYEFDFTKVFATLIDWFMGFVRFIIDSVAALPENISKFGNAIVEWFNNLPNLLSEQITLGLNMLNDLLGSIGEGLGNALSSLLDVRDKFLKWILRIALPDPNEEYSTFDPRNIARNVIPKELYDFAFSEPPKKEEGADKTSQITPIAVPQTGSALVEAGNKTQNNNVTIISAPNNGGNVTNVSSSSQVNNARVSAPIITGSTYDF